MKLIPSGGLPLFMCGMVVCGFVERVTAQPNIEHTALECIARGTYAVVLSGIDRSDDIRTAKVYFRSSLHRGYYYIEMKRREEGFFAILPQPDIETLGVVYYIEAVDSAYNTAHSTPVEVPVENACDEQPYAYFVEDEVRIVVGATTAGASPLPPGFAAAGIVGVIAATGVSGGVGGGVGVGAAVAVGAAGAAGAGIFIATGGPDTTTTTTAVGANGSPTPPPGPSSPTSTPGSSTTTVPGAATTTVSSSTSTIPGSSTTTSVVTSTSTSTITITTTTTTPPLDASCFSVSSPFNCQVRVDATCIGPPADRYDWVLDVGDQWQRVVINDAAAVEVHTWSLLQCPLLGGANLSFQLTATRGADSDTATKSAFINGRLLRAERQVRRALPMTLETHLAVPAGDGTAHARILLDGRLLGEVDSSQPVRIRTEVASGTRTVEAVVAKPGEAPGTWRFAFGEGTFVAGSLRILSGTALSISPNAVVFRVAGEPKERFSFSFEIGP